MEAKIKSLSSLFVVGLFVILIPKFASTQQTSPANKKIKEAIAAYGDLDFEKALILMKQAESMEGNSRDQLIHIFHIEGLCQSSLGRYEQARQSFAKLLTLDPSFRLSADVSPRVKKPFLAIQKKNPHQLEVRSIPPAAAWKDKPISFSFDVVADPARMLRSIKVWYRLKGQDKYRMTKTRLKGTIRTKGKGRTVVTIGPISDDKGKVDKGKKLLTWFAVAEGEHSSKLLFFNDASHPATLEIVSKESMVGIANPWYKRWWVWTIVGGVVAAGATTAAVLASRSSDSGPFDFDVTFSTLK